MLKKKVCNPLLTTITLLTFLVSALLPVPYVAAQTVALPAVGSMVHLSPAFTPSHLVGLTIHPDNALKFDFLIHHGDETLSSQQKKEQYTKLVKYFLASLTIPDEDQWVNLSPYEKDRIIKDNFGTTEMGRDLLAQDYILKQITSTLIYPEEEIGKKFWQRIYERAQKEYGTTNIPVNTFNKVWIVPDDAAVYESGNTVYVLRNHLKVLLEADYLAIQENASKSSPRTKDEGLPQERSLAIARDDAQQIGNDMVRQLILPELEREVNEGKNFANLRQIYSGMILATWYKKALRESLLAKIYANKEKMRGLEVQPTRGHVPEGAVSPSRLPSERGLNVKTTQGTDDIEYIYQQYLKAFKKGVFNYIKEDEDKYTHEIMPRKYFSGGTLKGYGVAGTPLIKEYSRSTPPTAAIVHQAFDEKNNVDRATIALSEQNALRSRTNAAMSAEPILYGGLTLAVALAAWGFDQSRAGNYLWLYSFKTGLSIRRLDKITYHPRVDSGDRDRLMALLDKLRTPEQHIAVVGAIISISRSMKYGEDEATIKGRIRNKYQSLLVEINKQISANLKDTKLTEEQRRKKYPFAYRASFQEAVVFQLKRLWEGQKQGDIAFKEFVKELRELFLNSRHEKVQQAAYGILSVLVKGFREFSRKVLEGLPSDAPWKEQYQALKAAFLSMKPSNAMTIDQAHSVRNQSAAMHSMEGIFTYHLKLFVQGDRAARFVALQGIETGFERRPHMDRTAVLEELVKLYDDPYNDDDLRSKIISMILTSNLSLDVVANFAKKVLIEVPVSAFAQKRALIYLEGGIQMFRIDTHQRLSPEKAKVYYELLLPFVYTSDLDLVGASLRALRFLNEIQEESVPSLFSSLSDGLFKKRLQVLFNQCLQVIKQTVETYEENLYLFQEHSTDPDEIRKRWQSQRNEAFFLGEIILSLIKSLGMEEELEISGVEDRVTKTWPKPRSMASPEDLMDLKDIMNKSDAPLDYLNGLFTKYNVVFWGSEVHSSSNTRSIPSILASLANEHTIDYVALPFTPEEGNEFEKFLKAKFGEVLWPYNYVGKDFWSFFKMFDLRNLSEEETGLLSQVIQMSMDTHDIFAPLLGKVKFIYYGSEKKSHEGDVGQQQMGGPIIEKADQGAHILVFGQTHAVAKIPLINPASLGAVHSVAHEVRQGISSLLTEKVGSIFVIGKDDVDNHNGLRPLSFSFIDDVKPAFGMNVKGTHLEQMNFDFFSPEKIVEAWDGIIIFDRNPSDSGDGGGGPRTDIPTAPPGGKTQKKDEKLETVNAAMQSPFLAVPIQEFLQKFLNQYFMKQKGNLRLMTINEVRFGDKVEVIRKKKSFNIDIVIPQNWFIPLIDTIRQLSLATEMDKAEALALSDRLMAAVKNNGYLIQGPVMSPDQARKAREEGNLLLNYHVVPPEALEAVGVTFRRDMKDADWRNYVTLYSHLVYGKQVAVKNGKPMLEYLLDKQTPVLVGDYIVSSKIIAESMQGVKNIEDYVLLIITDEIPILFLKNYTRFFEFLAKLSLDDIRRGNYEDGFNKARVVLSSVERGEIIDSLIWKKQFDLAENLARTFQFAPESAESILRKIKAAREKNSAMIQENVGGIDFNSKNLHLQIKRDGRGVPLPLSQQNMAQLSNIEGFIPTVEDIQPALGLPIFAELQKIMP